MLRERLVTERARPASQQQQCTVTVIPSLTRHHTEVTVITMIEQLEAFVFMLLTRVCQSTECHVLSALQLGKQRLGRDCA